MTDTEIKRDGQLAEIALGNLGAQIALIGYSGTKRNPTGGAVLSTGNAALLIKPGAGVPAIDAKTSAGAQTFLVNDAGVLVGIAHLFTPDNTVDIGGFAASRPRDLNLGRNAVIGGVLSVVGGQIVFPVVQIPSANAKTLDDYEKGTWTPVLVTTSTTTYTLQSATYTKIGNQVTVCCTLIVNVKAAGSSTASIGGFPFTVGVVPGTAAVNFWQSSATAYVFLAGLMAPATTQVDFYGVTAAAVSSSLAIFFQNAARIQFSGSYFV